MPEETRRRRSIELSLQLGQIACAQRRRDHLNRANTCENKHEWKQPILVPLLEQPRDEHLGKDGVHQIDYRCQQGGERNEAERPSCIRQVLPHEGKQGRRIARGNEIIARMQAQADAREGLPESLHIHLVFTRRRIADKRLVPPESAKHHEMEHIPVDDAGKARSFPQSIGFEAICLYRKTVALRRTRDSARLRPIAADTAVRTNLLEGKPFPICGAHHRQTGGTAFRRFHLHDKRDAGRLHAPAGTAADSEKATGSHC